jgi:putative glutamine amidotransferase
MVMKRKTIGIVGWKTGDNSFGATSTYLEYLNYFGNVRIIHPTDDILDLDLLILPGGKDMNPRSYKQAPGYFTSETDVHKQYFYDEKLQGYIDNQTPIFGICLGHQQLAVKFGQTLEQNYPWHEQSEARWKTAHAAKVVTPILELDTPILNCHKSFLKRLNTKFEVNSHHHQCVLLDNYNSDSDLLPILVDRVKNGVIESFMHKSLPIISVQWHPEELYDEYSETMINYLLNYKKTEVTAMLNVA